ncbi:MAG TPA: hypothetical protein VF739_01475, partial [Ktedonobacterales bacterium]
MAATRPLIEETSGQVPEEGELNAGLTHASGALGDIIAIDRSTDRSTDRADDVEIGDDVVAMDGMDDG